MCDQFESSDVLTIYWQQNILLNFLTNGYLTSINLYNKNDGH